MLNPERDSAADAVLLAGKDKSKQVA
jgi:hypothetical protein